MGRRGKVGVLLRVKEGYVKPVWDGKKLKPLAGIINGQEEYRAGGVYYLRFTDNGKARMENAGGDAVEVITFRDRRLAILELQTKAKAEGLAVVNLDDADRDVQGRVTIPAAIAAYIERLRRNKKYEPTIKAKQSELAEFAAFCRRRFMDQLSHDDMIDYREHLKAKKLQDQTVFNKLICVVTWQRRNPLCSVTGLLEFPDDYPEQKPTVPEPYSAKEIARLKQCATPRERLILNTFMATGCRDQEIAHLEYSDLNLCNNTIRIQKKDSFKWKPKSKAGTRNIPISAALVAELKATESGNRLIFPSARGGVETHFLRLFQRLGRRAGVSKIKLHRFRDTYATEQVRRAKTMDELMTVAARLGHTDLETIKTYAKLVEDTSRAAQESAEYMDSFGDPDRLDNRR